MVVIDFAPPRRCNCFWGKPNSQWLKYFLKAQFTMGWNRFWSNSNGQWVEIFSEGSSYNGLKWFWSNPNSQWVEIFSKGSIYNGLKLFLIQHRFEIGWNLFWMLIQVVPKFFRQYSVLFDLNGLDGQTKGITQILNRVYGSWMRKTLLHKSNYFYATCNFYFLLT